MERHAVEKVGTWVLSALHRNPGITAKAVETSDEISGGRFVFGVGSGHAGLQAHVFGLPEDHVHGRFVEALEIIVPLLRQGLANFEGTETPVRGSAEEIAALRAFGTADFTHVEVVAWPPTLAAVDAMAPVIELLDAD